MDMTGELCYQAPEKVIAYTFLPCFPACSRQRRLQALMTQTSEKIWFVYLVRTTNGSLYCGISDDAERRFAAHQRGRGARFFRTSPAQALVYVEACTSKSEALRRECAIKRMKKAAKEALIVSGHAMAGSSHERRESEASPCGA